MVLVREREVVSRVGGWSDWGEVSWIVVEIERLR